MIDREKVINGLEWILNDIEENGHGQISYYADEIREDIALLKEQEAIKPKEIAYAWRCGKCDEYLTAIENHRIRFCPYCGQEVKWK